MAKTKPNKQAHPTKDQLLAQQRQNEETNRKRRKVKQELYPALLAAAKSVEDAKMLCQILAAGIHQDFNNIMRTKKVADLGLQEKLNQDDPRYPFFKLVLDMFGDETISNAIEMVEGMPKHLDGCITQEMAGRELKDLKVEFMPEVPPLPTA